MTEQPPPQPPQQPPHHSPQQPPRKRLVRSRDNRMVAGVCGGLAEYLGVDATLVRIAVVVGTVLGAGALVVAYLLAWIFVPEE